MDYTQQDIFDTINLCENKQLWSLSATIAKHIHTLQKNITSKEKELSKAKEKSLDSLLPEDATDEDIRTRMRSYLVHKLNDKSISAQDIAQLKDIFGLASKTDDLTVEVVNFGEVVIDCPECGANVYTCESGNVEKAL